MEQCVAKYSVNEDVKPNKIYQRLQVQYSTVTTLLAEVNHLYGAKVKRLLYISAR